MKTGEWRQHPKLRRRFHPAHPDDLQVLIHEGGPRTASTRPELMWVRVTGQSDHAFVGTVLNTPTQLASIGRGSEVLFVVPSGFAHPVRVTEQYLAERSRWTIHPCAQCGMSELFDAPSALAATVFPGVAGIELFSARCPICGGAQVLEKSVQEPSTPTPQPWWRRWFSSSR